MHEVRDHDGPQRRGCTGAVCATSVTLFATLLVAAGASAATQAPAAAQALGVVAQQAASQPPASTPQVAAQQQTALQPAVDAVIAQGPAAVTQLLASAGAANPSVAADVLKRSSATTSGAPVTSSMAQSSRAVAVAAAVPCWPSVWQQVVRATAGVTLGWVYAGENGWCGNGTTITWHGGPAKVGPYAGGPYCVSGYSAPSAWDVPFSWIHVGAFGELGVSYAFGCAGLEPMKAAVRVAANGYWDTYNDFGV